MPSVFEELETEQVQYATQGERFINFLIDNIAAYVLNNIFIAIVYVIIALVTGVEIARGFATNMLFTMPVAAVSEFIFFTCMEALTKGRTLGKLVTRTQAVKAEDLSPISWKDAAIRSLSRLVPIEPFSALGNAPWHDKWSKTTVIKKRKRFV